jgi:hypothetical protein
MQLCSVVEHDVLLFDAAGNFAKLAKFFWPVDSGSEMQYRHLRKGSLPDVSHAIALQDHLIVCLARLARLGDLCGSVDPI